MKEQVMKTLLLNNMKFMLDKLTKFNLKYNFLPKNL